MSGLRPAKPGEVRNPTGSSKKVRLTKALIKIIDEKGLWEALAQTWLAMALGKHDLLENRKPEWQWFKELIDRVDGRAPELTAADDDGKRERRIAIPDVDPRYIGQRGRASKNGSSNGEKGK